MDAEAVLMLATPLDEQIVAILTKPCTSAEAAAVRSLAEDSLASLTAEADAADVASLSPLATTAQAHELRGHATDLRFQADRLDASVTALSARVIELTRQEARAIADAEHAAALVERDELAADIARDFPRIVGTLTRLVKRIRESDERCARAGIRESAEAIGRGVPAHFYAGPSPIMRIGDIQMPMPADVSPLAWDSPIEGYRYHGLTLADPAPSSSQRKGEN